MLSEPTLPASELAETALPNHLFRQAVEQAALAISITDAHANILYANAAFASMTGYGQQEIVGHNESILSYQVTPRLVYESLWAQLQRQRPWNGLLVNKRQDGERYLADVTITPVLNARGETSHYLGMQRDVTAVHRLERQVQNQKRLIESVVDAAQVAIALLNDQERVILDNQEYKKLIADLDGEPARLLLEKIRAQSGEAYQTTSTRRQNLLAQEVCITPQGRPVRWFSCAVSWFEEQDLTTDAFYAPQSQTYLLLTIQDISELKRQQETLRINSLRAMLAEQARVQELRETLSGAIYQLQSPFNVLQAATTLLRKRQGHPSGDLVQALESALEQGQEALAQLRASIPPLVEEEPQSLNLNEVLADVLKLSTPELLTAGIVVEWHPAQHGTTLRSCQTQLANLFSQLINNAIEAICARRNGPRELRLMCIPRPGWVAVNVEDSGPGIPPELHYQVFQPFFSTKQHQGCHPGLGLTMAQEIVNRHGGLLDIDPDYHTGCRMRVQLPTGEKYV